MAEVPDVNAAQQGVPVTPSNTGSIAQTRGLHVGVGGDIKVTFAGGGVAVLKGNPSGSLLVYAVTRVWLTGTTATDIVALY